MFLEKWAVHQHTLIEPAAEKHRKKIVLLQNVVDQTNLGKRHVSAPDITSARRVAWYWSGLPTRTGRRLKLRQDNGCFVFIGERQLKIFRYKVSPRVTHTSGNFLKVVALGIVLGLYGGFPVSAQENGMYGAMPDDGIDDSEAFAKLFKKGGVIDIPAGVWDFSERVEVNLRRSINLTAPEAVFKSNGVDGDLFRFFVTGSAEDDLIINWTGGTFDITGQKNSKVIPYTLQGAPVKDPGTRNTADALSIRGAFEDRKTGASTLKIARVSISHVSVVASQPGQNWETAGGDSGIFIIAGSAIIRDSYFRGLRDNAIYLSADGLMNENGGNYVVDTVVIEGSVKAIAVQRGADNVVIKNSILRDNEIGIVIDGTDDDSARDVVSTNVAIENNDIMGSWLGIRLSDVENISITGNKIGDLVSFGYLLDIPTADLYLWDHSQVSGVTYKNNFKADGTPYPDRTIGAGE